MSAAGLGDFEFDLLSPPTRAGREIPGGQRRLGAPSGARKAALVKRRADATAHRRQVLVEVATTSVGRSRTSAPLRGRERHASALSRAGRALVPAPALAIGRVHIAADSDSSVSLSQEDDASSFRAVRAAPSMRVESPDRMATHKHDGTLASGPANEAWQSTMRASASAPSRAGSRGRRVAFRAHAQLQDKVTYRILSPPANVREVNRARSAVAVEAAIAGAARTARSPRRFVSPLRARRADQRPAVAMAVEADFTGPPSISKPPEPCPPAECEQVSSPLGLERETSPPAGHTAPGLSGVVVPALDGRSAPTLADAAAASPLASPAPNVIAVPAAQPGWGSSTSSPGPPHGAVGRLSKLPQASTLQTRKRDRLVGRAEKTGRPSPPHSPLAANAHPLPRARGQEPKVKDTLGVLDLGDHVEEPVRRTHPAAGSQAPPSLPRRKKAGAPARLHRPQGLWKVLQGTAGVGTARPASPGCTPTCGGFLPEELEQWGMLLGIDARRRSLDDSLAPWGIALSIPT